MSFANIIFAEEVELLMSTIILVCSEEHAWTNGDAWRKRLMKNKTMKTEI